MTDVANHCLLRCFTLQLILLSVFHIPVSAELYTYTLRRGGPAQGQCRYLLNEPIYSFFDQISSLFNLFVFNLCELI